ncbi:MAG: hypothetical protein QXP94_00610 [Thermofilaceae archaeon]
MRFYKLINPGGLQAVKAALEALDSWVQADSEGGVRVVKIERIRTTPGMLEALVRISYKARSRRAWSDLFMLEAQQVGLEVFLEVHRISGIGRTDPDFLVDSLAKRLALQAVDDTGVN